MLRQYKLNGGVLVPIEQGIQIENPFGIDLDFDLNEKDVIIIQVHNTTKEKYEKRKKFNRAKVKRETQKFINEELDYLGEEK